MALSSSSFGSSLKSQADVFGFGKHRLNFTLGGNTRVTIRMLGPNDTGIVARLERQNKDMLLQTIKYHTKSSKELREKLAKDLGLAKAGKAFPSGIFLNETFAGRLGLEAIDRSNRSSVGYMGYWLDKKLHRRGIMSACLKHYTPFCFETLGLNHLDISCLPNNEASIRLARAAGFTHRPEIVDFEPESAVRMQVYSLSKTAGNESASSWRKHGFTTNFYHFMDSSSVPEYCYAKFDPETRGQKMYRSAAADTLIRRRDEQTF
eukprot:CAMPEP_0197539936 /NCGR_PEP_ID=MMETSP1318-20131121/64256_1 /TAXON_ID=552666 /ORGANISM="Partenskyella glossopodia, Strain RCC365" /LENGTH=262 /DNA_ID=CAMNT_0043098787 /DNA_START=108 /DNA_END=893 /DNA_ORIENTATION=-